MSLCDRLVNEQFEEEQQEPQQFEEEPEQEYFGEEGKWSSPPAYLFLNLCTCHFIKTYFMYPLH